MKELKRQKKERYKQNIKVDIPHFDESTMYTIEVFKFMNKYIDKMNSRVKNFGIVKEGVKLLQVALNGNVNAELDVIPEDPPENLELTRTRRNDMRDDETRLNEGDTGMAYLESHDYKNPDKATKKPMIYSLKHNEESKSVVSVSRNSGDELNDSELVNQYMNEH